MIHNNRIYSLSSHISPIIFRSLCFLSESQSFSKSLILLSISSLFLFGLKVYSPSRKQSPATEIMFSSMTHKFPFERAAMAEKMIKRAKARRNRHIREIMDNREEKLAKRIREAYRVWRSPICQWLRRIDSMGDLMVRLQERLGLYGACGTGTDDRSPCGAAKGEYDTIPGRTGQGDYRQNLPTGKKGCFLVGGKVHGGAGNRSRSRNPS